MHHVIVYAEQNRFAGWPANNGAWQWGDEILVGFTTGDYVVNAGHNIGERHRSRLARSLDGGETWQMESPSNFVGTGGTLAPVPGKIDFSAPGFAMRVIGDAYHGTAEPRGGFYYSYNRGKSWRGPFEFGGLSRLPQIAHASMTPRTDYLVNSADACLVFLSARAAEQWGADRTFCVRTTDGGLTFNFVSWVVPPDDPYRAVMPSTVRFSAMTLVSAQRRRDMQAAPSAGCWIDVYVSHDNGQSWAFLSRVGETGAHNGNPPALARLRDGRLCCVYGNRDRQQVLARYSGDEGATWSRELVLREGYDSGLSDQDFGYPRLVQRTDGCLVALYYWASRRHPYQHITATLWDPVE